MTHSELYRGLLKDISAFPVLDTHEHVESEARRLSRPVDLFNTFLIHYAACDLVSAGMPDGDLAFLRGDDADLERKWRVFAPHWANARNTAYCRSLLRASEAIYGVGDINETTWRVLDRAIKARNQKGLYRQVLKELCNIEASIVDSDPACDRQFFRTTLRVDGWLAPKSGGFLRANGERFGLPVARLDSWVALIAHMVREAHREQSLPCLKMGLAYERPLYFAERTHAEAEAAYRRVLESPAPVPFAERQPLEDYLMHALVGIAIAEDLPIQIHTGLQEGNGNFITYANPAHLANLFLQYPAARFDLFHGGYPYGGEFCALAKNFRNVTADLCWTNIISQEYSVRLIEELLDTVPANKIFVFGGDYCFVEGICGHLLLARENLALALANKVDRGYLRRDEALPLAHRMLYDNPKTFFRL